MSGDGFERRSGGSGPEWSAGDDRTTGAGRGPVQRRQLPRTTADLDGAPVQRRAAAAGGDDVGADAARGGGDSLPGSLTAKMNAAFGFDFGSVRVHEGAEAGALGAAAYTQGTDVHFAPGAYQPGTAAGQGLIGHELAHVVQQSEGRVAATTQYKGVEVNDDGGLEREADEWGERAARGEPVGRSGTATTPGAGATAQRKVVQRSPQTTHFGNFVDTSYTVIPGSGVTMHMKFSPGPNTDATKIGMTQSVKTSISGSPVVVDAQTAPRQVASGAGAGFEIDRVGGRDNPIYGSRSSGGTLAQTPQTNGPSGATLTPGTNATYELGHHFTDGSGEHTKPAWMFDTPAGLTVNNSSMEFETTALAIEGGQQGTYYGSVRWGWQRDGSGTVTAIPFTKVSDGDPSQNFLAAAQAWNGVTAGGTLRARNAPTQVYSRSGGSLNAAFTVAQNTRVTITSTVTAGNAIHHGVTIAEGSEAGRNGFMRPTDLADQGDGPATLDLPVPDVHTITRAQNLNDGLDGPWRNDSLPVGTRVVQEPGNRPGNSVPMTKVWVRVVDGALTGASGYVDRADLADERA